jgi:hypothetical protein
MGDEYRNPEDHGYWDGDVFIFMPPVPVMSNDGPCLIRELDMSKAVLADGIKLRDVIAALLNPKEGPEDVELRQMLQGH